MVTRAIRPPPAARLHRQAGAHIREFLLFLNNVNEVLIIIFFYMFVYNISLFIFFWMLLQFVSQKNTSISALVDLKANQLLLFIATIVLFSIAGVPPLLGFFPKLLILINLLNSNFFFFYIFFFVLLFFALYFYMQNVRFLYSTGKSKINLSFLVSTRLSTIFPLLAIFIVITLIFGIFFLQDLLLFFYWLLD